MENEDEMPVKIPLEFIIKRLCFEKGQLESEIDELKYELEQAAKKFEKKEKEFEKLRKKLEEPYVLSDGEWCKLIPEAERKIYKNNAFYRQLRDQLRLTLQQHQQEKKQWQKDRDYLISQLAKYQ